MSRGLIFWILMLLWLVGILYVNFGHGLPNYYGVGGSVVEFILFTLLGWAAFGPPVKG